MKKKRESDKDPDGFGQELREGGFCGGGSAARKASSHYETDVTDPGTLLAMGGGGKE